MRKAYDRLDWDFIRKSLFYSGFNDKWTNWIMQHVTTTTFRVAMNRKTSFLISPERGIRQGYPISPYIFIICFEDLGDIFILIASQPKSEVGIKINKDCPNIPFFMFTDDCLLFIGLHEE